MPSDILFLDTAYAIALVSPEDKWHSKAVALAQDTQARKLRMLTTQAIVLEIGNALSKPRLRPAAVELLTSILTDTRIEIVALIPALIRQAFGLFQQRPDKNWGMTDCTSFVVMKERAVHGALTTDEHFEQAGFTALLRH